MREEREMAQAQRFRANVGIVVLNNKWEVLALERINDEALKKGLKKGTGQWQMPQGGLDEGEEPEEAYLRELGEEIQVKAEDIEFISSYPEWLTYELPEKVREKPEVKEKQGRGQVQKWFYVWLKDSTKINLEPDDPAKKQEFFAYKWMSLGALAEETWEVRRPIYLKLALHLGVRKQQEETASSLAN